MLPSRKTDHEETAPPWGHRRHSRETDMQALLLGAQMVIAGEQVTVNVTEAGTW